MARQLSAEVMAIANLMQASPVHAGEKLLKLSEASPDQPEIRALYAIALRLQGKLHDSVQTLNQLIAQVPDFALAYREQAINLLTSGQLDEATDVIEKAIELEPRDPIPWEVYADILERLGRKDEAQKARQEAQKLHASISGGAAPSRELDEARHLLSQGNIQRAESICRAILAQNPNDVAAMCLLASIRQQVGDLRQAQDILERANSVDPNHPLARVTLAMVLQQLQEYEKANEHLRSVDVTQIRDPNALLLRARIHSDYAEYDEALKCYEILLSEFGKIPSALVEFGMTLRALGRQSEAIAAFHEAETLDPGRGLPWFFIADLKTGALNDDHIGRIERYLASPRVMPEDEMLLSFALGIAREERGDWDGAFEAYLKGNKNQKRMKPFHPETEHNRLEALRNGFDADLIETHKGAGCSAPDPIFVLGLPRSGSTLVEQILDSHSQVEGTFELPDMFKITEPLWNYGAAGDPANYCNWIRNQSSETLRTLGQEYIDRTQFWRTGNVYFTDKLLGNFMHIGLIKLILPNAKIIEVTKSPMAHCFSMWKQLFRTGMEFSYDLETLGAYYCEYRRLMDHWNALFPGDLLTLSYEELVAEPATTVRSLLDYCGLEFEEACLEPHQNVRVVRTTSSEQVRQPINDKAVHHWRHFEKHLTPLKNALGPVLN